MRFIAMLLVVAVCAAGTAYGQAGQVGMSLTLEESIERGLAASHRVDEASARRDASAAAIGERQAASRPQVSALAGYTRTNHVDVFGIQLPSGDLRVVYPDIPDNYRTRLDVQWPVYTGGRSSSLTAAARMEAAASADDVEALRVDVRFEITRAFWNLVVADESVRVVDESLARMGAHLRDVGNQLEQGLVPPNDLLNVQAQESRQRMLSIQARSARDVAEAELARLIGSPPGTRIQPSAMLEGTETDEALDALAKRALEQRGDRRALLNRLSAAGLRQTAAAAGRRPTVSIGGGVDYARPNPHIFPRDELWRTSWDASVSVSWPLFDGGRVRSEMSGAAATRRAVQARVDELDSMLALEVRQRLEEIEASRAAIAAAEDALRAATEARRVVGERFRAGVATSTDVLDSQVALLQSLLDRTQARAGVRLAQARLYRALGQ